jgi:hypothetical protein
MLYVVQKAATYKYITNSTNSTMLFSYKMTNDSGFAPNPFFGFMSLATCKPQIREYKKPEMYIAGFTSKKLCNEKVGLERMVFIMKVTEKIDFDTYYHDPRFQFKKPSADNRITKSGDNIYHSINGEFIQDRNFFHKTKNIKHDLSSKMVLLSNQFFYFGQGAIPIHQFKIKIPTGQTSHGHRTSDIDEIKKLWQYLENNFQKNCLIEPPHYWDNNEPFN